LTQSSAVALEVRGLTRRFGDFVAVDSLDLTVREGDVYGFLGPNGAGKTTAMRCMIGIIRADAGEVSFFGDRSLTQARRHVGAIVEIPGFQMWSSARNNLRYACAYAGLPRSEWGAEIERVLERVGLTDRQHDRVRTYSLGMKQRLGIARALLGSPRMLVLDEPTNGLDPAGMADMRDLIRSLALHDKTTILISSHLLSEVQAICNRVGIIQGGKLRAQGHVKELLSEHAQIGNAEVGAVDMAALEDALGRIEGVRVRGPGEEGRLLIDHGTLPLHELNTALHERGVSVDALVPATTNLEDVFLQVTQ
jgi:ABC-2 type transport system ATP-binding protein